MLNMTAKKKNEIKHMVKILEQIDLPDILLLTRDANTLLMRQKEAEKERKMRAYSEGKRQQKRKEARKNGMHRT